jgi:hypothetical protein
MQIAVTARSAWEMAPYTAAVASDYVEDVRVD